MTNEKRDKKDGEKKRGFNTRTLRYIDLFAGVGGFRLGIEKALGKVSECVFTNEWDKYCCQVYTRQFKANISAEDIRDINPDNIPAFDLLCGGFPCQSFSMSGKRKGFGDTRGTMFFEIERILKVKRPQFILLENVKGLLNHDGGKTFQIILQRLEGLGYSTQWMVLNSKFFGVPQNRERVFIIGCLGKGVGPEFLPIGDCEEDYNEANEEVSPTLTLELSHQWGRNIQCNLPKIGTIRRLTPLECERLQGFSDDFTAEGLNEKGEIVKISDTQRYKMMGNAVTVNVIEAIIKRWFVD